MSQIGNLRRILSESKSPWRIFSKNMSINCNLRDLESEILELEAKVNLLSGIRKEILFLLDKYKE